MWDQKRNKKSITMPIPLCVCVRVCLSLAKNRSRGRGHSEDTRDGDTGHEMTCWVVCSTLRDQLRWYGELGSLETMTPTSSSGGYG